MWYLRLHQHHPRHGPLAFLKMGNDPFTGLGVFLQRDAQQLRNTLAGDVTPSAPNFRLQSPTRSDQ